MMDPSTSRDTPDQDRGHHPVSGPGRVKIHAVEVWAQLHLCASDCERLREFFISVMGVPATKVLRHMHLTVYHARRPMPGVVPMSEAAHVVVNAADTRFMVMAPGGENPRDYLDPAQRKIGFRVQRQNDAMQDILGYRKRLIHYETEQVLGNRAGSTSKRSAFGARHWQPHVAVLRAGNGVDRDLTSMGSVFRSRGESLVFDRFVVDVVRFFGN